MVNNSVSAAAESTGHECEQRTRLDHPGQVVPAANPPTADPGPTTSRMNRKARLREQLVEATLFLIDRDGLDGLTMRALADHLGKSTAGTYRHVPSKVALIEMAADDVISRIVVPDPGSGSWEFRLRGIAQSTWHELRQHSWVAGFLIEREEITESQRVALAAAQAVLLDAGFTGQFLHLAFGFYWAFIFGSLSALRVSESTRLPLPKGSPDFHKKPPSADSHFEFGLGVMISGLRSQLETALCTVHP